MNDIQVQKDVQQAKAKLQEVAETKEARRDPRAGETNLINRRQELVNGRVPDEDRVIKEGKAKPKKKKFRQKLKEAMFSEDIGNGSVTEYIFFKVIVPSVKQVLYNAANTALCMALNLDPKTNKVIGSGTANTHTANASVYRNRVYNGGGAVGRKIPLQDYTWDEDTAKQYFNEMLEVADKYNDLSINNAYSICGLSTLIRTTDKNWGWTKAMLLRANVYPVDIYGKEWIIDLPEPRALG